MRLRKAMISLSASGRRPSQSAVIFYFFCFALIVFVACLIIAIFFLLSFLLTIWRPYFNFSFSLVVLLSSPSCSISIYVVVAGGG
ncbi:uncharacterized protein P174DRAFT_84695 [Aspergillus novofumigatus IBT 16806]|uniref:Uncharacterized protein n=1 Tax=Aspergillus novofumigatus (strain IBT 16806) TaxID=1392255 RepID=A0A2I1CG94_ASPN1|nr:uncharacterized protein P174DRAFT_84695 [Aspergillus novofumigatus IBT 16806]PKX96634.1 hypothetical protein P174DRAFT_84695 [Aspergillus novofumigatus IBT 16806]